MQEKGTQETVKCTEVMHLNEKNDNGEVTVED